MEDVYLATSAKLFGICLRILRDRAEAEEVLQEVYMTVWRRADSFRPERASPITWLAAVARNRAIDRLRSRGPHSRRAPLGEALTAEDPRPLPDQALLANERLRRLYTCLDALEPERKALLREAFFGGVTYLELSSSHDVPLGTMKSWIRRSLLRLRECLDP